MNDRARTRGAYEVHASEETAGQEITHECTGVHAPEVHAPDPLFRGGGHPHDWKERLQAAVAASCQRRQKARQLRAQLAAARAIGLQRRHTAKLTRKERP